MFGLLADKKWVQMHENSNLSAIELIFSTTCIILKCVHTYNLGVHCAWNIISMYITLVNVISLLKIHKYLDSVEISPFNNWYHDTYNINYNMTNNKQKRHIFKLSFPVFSFETHFWVSCLQVISVLSPF